MRIAVTLLGCVLAGASTACVSQPPVASDTPLGLVRGHDEESVQRVVEALELGPTIRDRLESTRGRPRILLVQTSRTESGGYGTCYARAIVLGSDAWTPDFREARAYCVAHELVHWYTKDSPYENLPLFVQEGLADHLGAELTGGRAWMRVEKIRARELPFHPEDLQADIEGWIARDERFTVDWTRIGNEVVERLGMQRLRELAAAGTDPMGYLEAADMTPRVPLELRTSESLHCVVTWYDDAGRVIATEALPAQGPLLVAYGSSRAEGAATNEWIEPHCVEAEAYGSAPPGAATCRLRWVAGDPEYWISPAATK